MPVTWPMKIIDLPPVSPPLKDEYRRLIEDAGNQIAELSSRLHDHLHCAPGCSACCRKFRITAIEAALICERKKRTSAPPQTAQADDQCGLLDDDRCAIYSDRPLICRTQGLPIGYIDELNEQIDVSVCPLNFHDQYQFTYEDLLLIDPLNSRLSELNSRYCEDNDIDVNIRIFLE